MSTIYVFNDEITTAETAVADDDVLLMHDTSGKLKKTVTAAVLRSSIDGGVVATTAGATTLTITAASHAGKTVVLNNTAPIAVTLPQATGTGNKYRFFVFQPATATASTIKVANATDVMAGNVYVVTTTATNTEGFATSATSDTISANGTTLGGILGDVWEIFDVKTGVFAVTGFTSATGTEATPFSATV